MSLTPLLFSLVDCYLAHLTSAPGNIVGIVWPRTVPHQYVGPEDLQRTSREVSSTADSSQTDSYLTAAHTTAARLKTSPN